MEYSVEELKNALIERCEKEGILYATVAMDRRTKEMILPDTLEGALKHPEYFVFPSHLMRAVPLSLY